MLQIKVPFLPMSAWLPKVVEPSKQQGLAAVFFLILYPYYLIRGSLTFSPPFLGLTEKISQILSFGMIIEFWHVLKIFVSNAGFFSAFTKKLKAKKTQTQGKWIKNSTIFPKLKA